VEQHSIGNIKHGRKEENRRMEAGETISKDISSTRLRPHVIVKKKGEGKQPGGPLYGRSRGSGQRGSTSYKVNLAKCPEGGLGRCSTAGG